MKKLTTVAAKKVLGGTGTSPTLCKDAGGEMHNGKCVVITD
jgi:hypothetical protein